MPKLGGEVPAAARLAGDPGPQGVRAISPCEIVHEARAIEIRVHPDLEVHARALGLEAQRIPEVTRVANHGPEHHLVPRPLCTTVAAGHPRLAKHCDSLMVPPGA